MAVLNLNYSLVSESAANKVSMPNYIYTDPGKFCTSRELLETVYDYNNKVRDLQLAFAEATNTMGVLQEGEVLEKVKNFFVGIIKALINLIKDIAKTIINLIKALIYAIMGKAYKRDDEKEKESSYREILADALQENPITIPCVDLTPTDYLKSGNFPIDFTAVMDPILKAIGEMKSFIADGYGYSADYNDSIAYLEEIEETFDRISKQITYLLFGDFYNVYGEVEASDVNGNIAKDVARRAFGSTDVNDVKLSVSLYDQAKSNMATDTKKIVEHYKKLEREVQNQTDKVTKDLDQLKGFFNNQMFIKASYGNQDGAQLYSNAANVVTNFATIIKFTDVSYQNLVTAKLTRLAQLFGNASYSAKVIKKCDQIVAAYKKDKTATPKSESCKDTAYYCEKFLEEFDMFIEANNESLFTEQLESLLEADTPAQQQTAPTNNQQNQQANQQKVAEDNKKEDKKAEGFWAKIKAFFKKIWEGIKGIFKKVEEKTQEILNADNAKWWQENRIRFVQDKPLAGAGYKYSTIPCYNQAVYNNDTLLESTKGQGTEALFVTKAYNAIKNNYDQNNAEEEIENYSNLSQEEFTAKLEEEKSRILTELSRGFADLSGVENKDMDKAFTNLYIKAPANETPTPFNKIVPGSGAKDAPATTANNFYTSMVEYVDNYVGGKAALTTIRAEQKMLNDLETRLNKRVTDVEAKLKAKREKLQAEKAQQVIDQTNKEGGEDARSAQVNQRGDDNSKVMGKNESFSLANALGISGTSVLYEELGGAPDPNADNASAEARTTQLSGSDGNANATADQHNEDSRNEELKIEIGMNRWSQIKRTEYEILGRLIGKRASLAEKAYNEYMTSFKQMDGYLDGLKKKAKADQKAAKDAAAAQQQEITKKNNEAETNPDGVTSAN